MDQTFKFRQHPARAGNVQIDILDDSGGVIESRTYAESEWAKLLTKANGPPVNSAEFVRPPDGTTVSFNDKEKTLAVHLDETARRTAELLSVPAPLVGETGDPPFGGDVGTEVDGGGEKWPAPDELEPGDAGYKGPDE